MGFAGRIARRMDMLVMLIMPVEMLMGKGFVPMQMSVSLRQMKRDSNNHERTRDPEKERRWFM
jgi:hypothetical protein